MKSSLRSKLPLGGMAVRINGWLFVRLEGDPKERGFQHGVVLANEIRDMIERVSLWAERSLPAGWDFFREAGRKLYKRRMTEENEIELKSMAEGAKKRGVNVDFVDLVALNGYEDSLNYFTWLRRLKTGIQKPAGCSGFVATGRSTKGGEIVCAHNTWWPFIIGNAMNVIMHVVPDDGFSFMMQTKPGFLFSGTDWFINGAGLVVTETSNYGITTFETNGIPSFVRGRTAMQYTNGIDSWVQVMKKENNGGIASTWLLGDVKSREIARFELGTLETDLVRTFDGFFYSCNMPFSEKVRSESDFDYTNTANSSYARSLRWQSLAQSRYGKIDEFVAMDFMKDHHDSSVGREHPSGCSICGHVEADPRGLPECEWGPHYPGGSFDCKVTTSKLVREEAFWAKWGRPCDGLFSADEFLANHTDYSWQKPLLHDVAAFPWALFGGIQLKRR